MAKDFESFYSRIKGRKVTFFGRIYSNFRFEKVNCWLFHSGRVGILRLRTPTPDRAKHVNQPIKSSLTRVTFLCSEQGLYRICVLGEESVEAVVLLADSVRDQFHLHSLSKPTEVLHLRTLSTTRSPV